MSERPVLAHHEAAHAVAAWALWRPFDYVTVLADHDSAGHLSHILPRDLASWCFAGDLDTAVSDLGIIALVGSVAESYYRGHTVGASFEVEVGLTSDERDAIDCAVEHSSCTLGPNGEFDVEKPLQRMLDAAEGLVVDQWGAIRAVAEALLVEDTLSYMQVAEIAGKAPPAYPPVVGWSGQRPLEIPPCYWPEGSQTTRRWRKDGLNSHRSDRVTPEANV